MSDPRLTPANGRVAAEWLRGQVVAESYSPGLRFQVAVPVCDLLRAPAGPRDRQLLLGEAVTVFEQRDGHAFVQAERDGYVGYVAASQLAELAEATHRVATPATHVYAAADMKSPDLMRLSFGARLKVIDERRAYFETPQGFVPKRHLRPLDRPFSDPVTVAQLFFGVPYLWGGNSSLGIDCSGLVQAGCLAAGIACPGDSDMQSTGMGDALTDSDALQRGDLVFWKGHVGIMVDEATLLHANAHHMAVAYEPLAKAVERIARDAGPVTVRRRIR